MQVSWTDFKSGMRQQIWPEGEASRLVSAHDAYFQEAMSDLQTWVRQLQQNNTDVYPFCATFWECNKTIVPAPRGVVRRIFTILDEWCNKVFYDSASFTEVEAWARQITGTTAPDSEEVQQGIRYAEASSDNTCGSKRARRGIWAIYRQRLYLAPWIQSNESVVIEWDGVKPAYSDSDLLDDEEWGISEKEAIKLFVQAKHEMFFGDKTFAKTLEARYQEARADLIWERNNQTKQQPVQISDMDRYPTEAELTADEG